MTNLPGAGSLFGTSNYMAFFAPGVIKTRNTEATFLVGNFVNLPLMLMSTAMMPKAFLPDWMQKVVQINPVTYGIEGMCGLITTGFDPNQVFSAILVLGSVAVLSIVGATFMFRSRVA